MKKIRFMLYIILILSCSLLSGCWDIREIDELGFVTAVGVDKAQPPNKYSVTVQIANVNLFISIIVGFRKAILFFGVLIKAKNRWKPVLYNKRFFNCRLSQLAILRGFTAFLLPIAYLPVASCLHSV